MNYRVKVELSDPILRPGMKISTEVPQTGAVEAMIMLLATCTDFETAERYRAKLEAELRAKQTEEEAGD